VVGDVDPSPVPGEDMEYIVALKGLAPPAAPVAWGRSPTPSVGHAGGCMFIAPTPVGCCPVLEAPVPRVVVPFGADVEDGLLGIPVALGVVGPDCGIGGSDSNKDAPKDDVGLNGLRPLKPVIWGFSWLPGAELEEVMVAPVACDDSDEKEENKSDAVDAVVVEDVL